MDILCCESRLPLFAIRKLELQMNARSIVPNVPVRVLTVVNASSLVWCNCIEAVDRFADVHVDLERRIYCSYLSLDDFLDHQVQIELGVLIVGIDVQSYIMHGDAILRRLANLLEQEFLEVIPLLDTEEILEEVLTDLAPLVPIFLLENSPAIDYAMVVGSNLTVGAAQVLELV